jgi:type II secretory pathway pseudopilin PulG
MIVSARLKKSRRGRRGFTLLEAIVTIVVLIVTLPAIVAGFDLASRIALATKQRAEATALARSRMDYLVATGGWQNGDGLTYEETDGNTTFQCVGSLETWDEANVQQLTNVQQLDMSVTWTFEGKENVVTISTVVYLPDYTPQAPGTTSGVL